MKSNFHQYPGFVNKSYSSPTDSWSTSSETSAGQKSFIAGNVSAGNHKTPTSHSYSLDHISVLDRGYVSSRRTDPVGSAFTYIEEGNLGLGITPTISFPNWMYPTAYNEALQELYSRVRGELDLSVDAFQARQTAQMFTASSKLELLAGRYGRLRRVGSAWLEWVYGWKPLASTIYGIADESIRFILNDTKSFKVRRSVKDRTNESSLLLAVIPPGRETMDVDYEVKVEVKVRFRQPNDKSDFRRFSSLNPASIAWELLPYSFVLDWVYDVGGFLRAAESCLLYSKDFMDGYVSTTTAAKGKVSTTINGVSVYNSSIHNEAYYTSERNSVSFSRTPLTAPPFPRLPSLRPDLGASRLLSAAALLSQKLR
jgi:hypothetical protein